MSEGGTITKVADLNTPVPDGVGTFPRFQQPVIDDGIVAFQSYDALNEPGIFLADEGTITRINSDVGRGLSNPSLNAGSVAFEAFVGTDSHGIYTTLDGMLSKLIDVTDTLDGKTFNPNSTISFSVGDDGISGNQIAFRAVFADGSQGLFLATLVPEPSSTAPLGLTIAALIGHGFSRCRRLGRQCYRW